MLFKAALRVLVIFVLSHSAYGSQLTILLYHHIDSSTPRSTSTSPEEFAAHLNYLKQNNFTVLPLKSALDDLYSGNPLPTKAVAITFDDGYQSIYHHAWPLLKQFDFPFTVFIDTHSVLDNSSLMMSWNQLKQMHQQGVSIGNHSQTHAHMLSQTEAQWKQEILSAQDQLAANLGQLDKLFAYPYGEHSSELMSLLERNNYYGFSQVSGVVNPNTPAQSIPRFSFSGAYAELEEFKLKVNTLSLPVLAISPQNPYFAKPNTQFKMSVDESKISINKIECFYKGKPVATKIDSSRELFINLDEHPHAGRSRINCTAPTKQSGVFYWHSIPIFTQPKNNIWPE